MSLFSLFKKDKQTKNEVVRSVQSPEYTPRKIGNVDAIKKAHDIFMKGDISKLNLNEQVSYIKGLCSSLGLNPLTKPIEFLKLSGGLTPYVKKDGTDQLRKLYSVSITSLETERVDGVFLVKAHAELPCGRKDSSTGAVNIMNAKGDALCNALMKAETKAKRRATLSICGLGFLDESETETIPDAEPYHILTREELPDTFLDLIRAMGGNRGAFFKKEGIDKNALKEVLSKLTEHERDNLIERAKDFILEFNS